MTLTAKFSGTCTKCRQHINVGEQINWEKSAGASHVICSKITTQKSTWGNHGIRYDEDCDSCGRCSEVDNNSGRCQRCHREPEKTVNICAEPYRRGIGQGFGSTEDGNI